MAYTRTCEICSKKFLHTFKHTKTCSKECHDERVKFSTASNLPTNFLGKLHETQVCIDLGLKGYDVYYSFYPQQKYDLIIRNRKDGKLLIIEVKTGYRLRATNKVSHPKHTHSDWDIMAIVIRASNEIVYFDKDRNVVEL